MLGLGLPLPIEKYYGPPTWVPAGASLAMNFQTAQYYPGVLTDLISVSRAAPATTYAQDAAGNLIPFAANTARVTNLGLLVEEARTNLCIQSQAFDNAAWTKTDITVTADNTAAPDGTNTADLITEGSAGTAIIDGTAGTVTTSTASTASIYIKRGNTQWIRMLLSDNSATNVAQAWFDITNGVLGTASVNNGSPTGISSTITPVANGFYRITLTATLSTSVSARIRIDSASANGSATRVSGSTYYLWGGQIENAAFPTSYTPTTTVAVARSADVPQFIGQGAVALANSHAAFFQTYGGTTANSNRLIDYGSALMFFASSTAADIGVSGVNTAATLGSGSLSGLVKIAYGYDATGLSAIANAGTKSTSATVWAFSGTPYLGNRSAGDRAFGGYIQAIYFGPTKGMFDGLTDPATSPDVSLNFAAGTYSYLGVGLPLSNFVTVSRASPATTYAQNSAGLLVPFAANVARITDLGLLVEEARTNLTLQSQTFDNAAWTATSATVTADQTVAPDGTTTADLVTGTASADFIRNTSAVTVASGSTYTTTIYVKPGNIAWARIMATDSGGSTNGVQTWFNLSGAGAVGNTGTRGTGWTNVSGSITALANGWYRCSVTYTTGATTLFVSAQSATGNLGGNVANATYYLWGAQSELGAFATSCIPTTTVGITRSAENIAGTTRLLSFFQSSAITQYSKVGAAPGADSPRLGVGFSAATQSAATPASKNAGNNTQVAVFTGTGGVNSTATVGNSGTFATGPVMAVGSYDSTGDSIVANGGTETTSVNTFTVPTGVWVGSNQAAGAFLNGYMATLKAWSQRLPAATRQTLSGS